MFNALRRAYPLVQFLLELVCPIYIVVSRTHLFLSDVHFAHILAWYASHCYHCNGWHIFLLYVSQYALWHGYTTFWNTKSALIWRRIGSESDPNRKILFGTDSVLIQIQIPKILNRHWFSADSDPNSVLYCSLAIPLDFHNIPSQLTFYNQCSQKW